MNQASIDRLFRGTGNVKLRSIRAGVVDELALLDRANEEYRISRNGGMDLPEHIQINRMVDSYADRYHATQAAQLAAAREAKRSGLASPAATAAGSMQMNTGNAASYNMFASGQQDGKMPETTEPRYKTGVIFKDMKGTTPVAVRKPYDVFEVSRQIQDGGHDVPTLQSALYPHQKPLADEPRKLGRRSAFQTGLSREMKMWRDPNFTAVNCALPQRARLGVPEDSVVSMPAPAVSCHSSVVLASPGDVTWRNYRYSNSGNRDEEPAPLRIVQHNLDGTGGFIHKRKAPGANPPQAKRNSGGRFFSGADCGSSHFAHRKMPNFA